MPLRLLATFVIFPESADRAARKQIRQNLPGRALTEFGGYLDPAGKFR